MDLAVTPLALTLATYPAASAPTVSIPFETDSITVLNGSTTVTDIIYVSFDGETDHGILIPGIAQAINWTSKRRAVWLRLSAPGAVTAYVMANTVR